MPNQRRQGIVNVSFTMPAPLAEALDARARSEMTNKSEIVRRALLSALGPEEAARIRECVLNDGADEAAPAAAKKKVNYKKPKA